MRRGPKPYEPTQKQIKAAAAMIREGWNERTYRLRSGVPLSKVDRLSQWVAPAFIIRELDDIIQEHEYCY